tara:strand:+ start:3562 stop:3786 length:225 start_codon:yes stop_codon:yes gene_type:complete
MRLLAEKFKINPRSCLQILNKAVGKDKHPFKFQYIRFEIKIYNGKKSIYLIFKISSSKKSLKNQLKKQCYLHLI